MPADRDGHERAGEPMAFRLRLDEPIEKGFRRIGAEQIERARRQLEAHRDPAVEVHEARKCLKRVRALLRLGREGIGEATFRSENARFRAIAKRLAPARDNHVLLETLTRLEAERSEGPLGATLGRLKAALLSEASQGPAGSRAADAGLAQAELAKALRRFRRLTIEPNDFATLARGVTRSYRRGLEWLGAAYAETTDEAFHEWRKSVQTHWRHMALLVRMWPEMVEARVAAARELSQILGEDHDLSLLKHHLAELGDGALSRAERGSVEALIRERQRVLRAAARPRGQMIFAERPKAHGRRIASVWDAAATRLREEKRAGRADAAEKPGGDALAPAAPTRLQPV